MASEAEAGGNSLRQQARRGGDFYWVNKRNSIKGNINEDEHNWISVSCVTSFKAFANAAPDFDSISLKRFPRNSRRKSSGTKTDANVPIWSSLRSGELWWLCSFDPFESVSSQVAENVFSSEWLQRRTFNFRTFDVILRLSELSRASTKSIRFCCKLGTNSLYETISLPQTEVDAITRHKIIIKSWKNHRNSAGWTFSNYFGDFIILRCNSRIDGTAASPSRNLSANIWRQFIQLCSIGSEQFLAPFGSHYTQRETET